LPHGRRDTVQHALVRRRKRNTAPRQINKPVHTAPHCGESTGDGARGHTCILGHRTGAPPLETLESGSPQPEQLIAKDLHEGLLLLVRLELATLLLVDRIERRESPPEHLHLIPGRGNDGPHRRLKIVHLFVERLVVPVVATLDESLQIFKRIHLQQPRHKLGALGPCRRVADQHIQQCQGIGASAQLTT
jgi:hypothetical protein